MTQVLRLLQVAPQVIAKVLALSDPINVRVIGADTLRSIARLSAQEQGRRFLQLINEVRV